jgi:hypothetical protein
MGIMVEPLKHQKWDRTELGKHSAKGLAMMNMLGSPWFHLIH